jgi:hypothetical protein
VAGRSADGRPTACVRVVADAAAGAVFRPATLLRLCTALAELPTVGRVLVTWAGHLGVRAGTAPSTKHIPIHESKEVR